MFNETFNLHRDFIDVYLAEVKKTTDPTSVFYGAAAGTHKESLNYGIGKGYLQALIF